MLRSAILCIGGAEAIKRKDSNQVTMLYLRISAFLYFYINANLKKG